MKNQSLFFGSFFKKLATIMLIAFISIFAIACGGSDKSELLAEIEVLIRGEKFDDARSKIATLKEEENIVKIQKRSSTRRTN